MLDRNLFSMASIGTTAISQCKYISLHARTCFALQCPSEKPHAELSRDNSLTGEGVRNSLDDRLAFFPFFFFSVNSLQARQ